MPAPIVVELFAVVGFSAVIAGGVAVLRNIKRKPKGPICSCAHGYGTHEPNGRCHGEIKRGRGMDGYEWVPCPCQRYDGPQPLGEVWVPPMDLT